MGFGAMTGHDGEVIFTRDLSSGKIHKRIRLGDSLMSYEADNLDQSGAYEVITALDMADVSDGSLCERCFGEPPSDGDEDAA